VNGTIFNVTCYDIFDDVTPGQSWTANELTLDQAIAGGQFSGDANANAGYHQIAFLSQQATNSAQDQIDLQEDIWNVFAPNTYAVTAGMQTYLNLLTTPTFTTFNFAPIRFLEDVNQTGQNGVARVQAFVFDPHTETPEPGTIMLLGTGLLLVGIGRIHRKAGR
jgi:hypothetical protein